ncbi:MAG: outer membrane protein assembly factor BamC [Burkholderiales bacterium]|nr:outer membrane protein assembly factor BamC [Burkholderiales bacterium]
MRRLERGVRRVAVCAGLAAALGACSSLPEINIESKKVDYKSAGKLPPLEVPPDLTRPQPNERYTVPDVNQRGTATYSDYSRDRAGKPAATGAALVLPQQDNVRVERQGNQRWLVVKGRPGEVWPIVKDFWQESGFILNVELPEAGVMETDWNENRARISDPGFIRGILGKLLDQVYSTSERDKFRTRLEIGAEPGTTEIYISHRGMEEVFTGTNQDTTKWQPRPVDPELEAEMLRRLMVRFGVQETRAKTQVAAASAKTPPRATLTSTATGAGAGTLALHEQFDRAWRSVGLALDRVGFTVEDRDRSKGVYFVRYIDPQIDNKQPASQQGWFSRLKFWGGDESKAKNEQYRIQVSGAESGALVSVLNKEGSQDNSETARRILTLLYDQLK